MSAMSAGARRRRTPKPDRLCVEAADMAREAAEELARPGMVGEWIEAVADDDRVVTHLFTCLEPGYRGWRWASTVARASRARVVTLDETVLLPGPDSLLAPEWLPWSERLRPGDLGPGDLLPTEGEDLRLEPGFSGEDTPPPNSAVAGETELAETAEEPEPDREAALPARAGIGSLAEELGMGRARVLSRHGLLEAADRWEEAHGSRTPMAQAAPASCVSCGFLVPLTGSLRQAFGVCANEYSPADGQVVSLSYGCGAHSEAAVMPKPPQPPPPVIDETRADAFALHDEPGASGTPAKSAAGTETQAGETGGDGGVTGTGNGGEDGGDGRGEDGGADTREGNGAGTSGRSRTGGGRTASRSGKAGGKTKSDAGTKGKARTKTKAEAGGKDTAKEHKTGPKARTTGKTKGETRAKAGAEGKSTGTARATSYAKAGAEAKESRTGTKARSTGKAKAAARTRTRTRTKAAADSGAEEKAAEAEDT